MFVVLALLAFPAGASAVSFTWNGTWETGIRVWGTMTLTGDVNGMEGTYTWDEGHMRGSLTDPATRTYTGWWDEVPSRTAPADAGEVILTVNADGKSFGGQWRYGSEGNWIPLSGTCTAGACLSNVLEDPEPADWALPDPIVPFASVINGCGGGTASTDSRTWDTSSFRNSWASSKRYPVNFRAACNVHDAGYSGAKVRDPLRNNAIVDFWGWDQKRIDDRFLFDMRAICNRSIPRFAKGARADCVSRGGLTSFGAKWRYDIVRSVGHRYYVARPAFTGTWTAPDGTAWTFSQRTRRIEATWSKGNERGIAKAIITSRDTDSLIRGFEKVKKADGTWIIDDFNGVWRKTRPNRFSVLSPSLGNVVLTRSSQ